MNKKRTNTLFNIGKAYNACCLFLGVRKVHKVHCMMLIMAMTAFVCLTACGRSEDSAEDNGFEVIAEQLPDVPEQSEQENKIPEGTDRKEMENIAEPSIQDFSDGKKSASDTNIYKSILSGSRNFICMDTGYENKSLNIKEIGQIITDDDSVSVNVEKFAVVDLDSDGEKEAVLWIQINGINDYGFEVLHELNGEIYGHTLAYREFMNLKADGTFMMSGGASDTGIGKLTFSGTECNITGQIRCYSKSEDVNGEVIIQQFINDEPCSAADVEEVLNNQEQKADVKWYELSEDNINALL